MRDFRDLVVWNKSMDLAHECYRASEAFSPSERFGLASQLRRSGVSVPSNIAEGSGRGSSREFVRFLQIAYGSACEVETQALIAEELEMGEPDRLSLIKDLADEVRRMLHGLIKEVKRDYS